MVRRWVAPILRVLAFFAILLLPLALAAIAQGAEPGSLVVLRSVTLAERPADRWPSGPRLSASQPARLMEREGAKVRLEADGPRGRVGGWTDGDAVFLLDDPAQSAAQLVDRARLLLSQGDRPVLAAAFLSEAVRREPKNVEAWRLLGQAGERVAQTAGSLDRGTPAAVTLAARWNVVVVPGAKGWRYDGAAYRALVALDPPAPLAEEARLRLLSACGPEVDPARPDPGAASVRERDLGEFLVSFPASPKRLGLLFERARLLAALAETAAREGKREEASARREAAIEAASEVSASAPDLARRRAADRLIARLTRSFPKRTDSERPVVSASGFRAQFVTHGATATLEVTRADGRPAIQPYPVNGPDPATLAFDPTGTKLAWDETPEPGRRRTRLLDLERAKLVEVAGAAEPELVAMPGAGASGRPDRYTSFLGFSPDGTALLVVSEGFTAEGTRIPRRHYLCDVEGRRLPSLVERPFSAPNTIDWQRVLSRDRPNV